MPPLRRLTALVLGLLGAFPALFGGELASPDGRLRVEVRLNAAGEPTYAIHRSGALVVGESRLGLVLADANLSTGLRLVEETRARRVSERYQLAAAKRRVNTYVANRKTWRLASADGARLDVIFQVSDDGVAFRYLLPEAASTPREVREEATSFRFGADTRAWLQPMSVAKTGWARTNPSYEEYYESDIPVGAPSPLGAGWVFPALFRAGDTWVLLSESGLGRGYCATRLRHEAPGGEYRIGFPDTRETIGDQPVEPRFITPYATPWRVIALGDLATVVQSSLGTDLADAPARGARPGLPGVASWSWPKLGDARTDYATSRRFIDYAAEMGWGYCLIDALWDTQIGDEKLKQLADHARAKNVSLILWYNTNGDWNDAFQTPKHRLLTRESRRAEFERLQALGVKGIKVDFFGGDGRAFVDLYHDILEDSAPYGLTVNFHGATLPRGWQRTYPHLMTVEAVRGYEFITFEQANADRAPAHMAMLPFTRNVFDPMDFTPLCLEGPGRIRRLTTVGAELATTVLFTSGIQHMVEIPDAMEKQPDYVKTFLRELPAAWEDSRFLAGEPGKLAVLARRAADGRWWIAGLNGESTTKSVELDLAAIAPGAAGLDLITDAEAGGFERRASALRDGKLRVELAPYGGFSAVTDAAPERAARGVGLIRRK